MSSSVAELMYRVGFGRFAGQVGSRRVALAFRARGKSLLSRSYAASAGGQGSSNGANPLGLALGAAAALSAIYYVYPFEKKPKQEPQAEEEPKQAEEEPSEEPSEEPAEEPVEESQEESQTEEEPTQESKEPAEESNDEPQQQPEAAESNSEPTTENTIASTDSKQPGKSIKSDEEIQKIEEAQLEPTNKEAEQEGAYNPDTGEINWDCPCLGGMAQGPCGEEFKLAFSCFVYSEAEPKGIDCVEKFQGMQECFRKYPDHYAEQLKDEDEAVAAREESIAAATSGEEAKQGTKAEENSEKAAPESDSSEKATPEKSEESSPAEESTQAEKDEPTENNE